jgi:hypothetical protein
VDDCSWLEPEVWLLSLPRCCLDVLSWLAGVAAAGFAD